MQENVLHLIVTNFKSGLYRFQRKINTIHRGIDLKMIQFLVLHQLQIYLISG